MDVDEETPAEKLERFRAKLTYEQRFFCEYYIATQDAPRAYKQAYDTHNPGRAYALLEKWYIVDYIQALGDTGVDGLLLTRAEIISTLRDVMRKSGTEDRDRIRAAEVAAKVTGLGAPKKVEHSGEVKTKGLSDEQIQDLRSKLLGLDPDALARENAQDSHE